MIEGIQNERNKDRAMKKQSLTKKTSFFDENTKEKKISNIKNTFILFLNKVFGLLSLR